MTPFDRSGAAGTYGQEAAAALDQLSRTIPGAVRPDLRTGTVEIDEGAVRAAVADAVPGPAGERIAASLLAYAGAGVVALPGPGGEPMAMPWLALEDITYLSGGADRSVRQALGVGRVDAGGTRTAARLHERFTGLPADVFAAPQAALLGRDPHLGLPNGPPDPPDPPDPPPGQSTPPARGRTIPVAGNVTLGPAATAVDPTDVFAIAKCLIDGTWSGWWHDPVFNTDYMLGFKVCIGYDCADALATYLLRFFAPSPTSLATAFAAGLKAGSAAAGVTSMVSGASMWIALCTFLTGMEITFANTGNGKRGVCLYCSWPWVGIPIFAVAR